MPANLSSSDAPDSLVNLYQKTRDYSTNLLMGLTPEDCQSQSMDDASPTKWHLAHVTWFFEVMVLKQFESDFKYWRAEFAVLFNSYYNIIGDKHPRAKRGLLTRPSLEEVLEWRKNIDSRVVNLLNNAPTQEIEWLITIGINHEQQHQELIQTDLQHLFSNNSLHPVYSKVPRSLNTVTNEPQWIGLKDGLNQVGFEGEGFHFDNESPRHSVYVQKSAMRSSLVTNAEWLEFMRSGGYQNSSLWLDEGWAWVQRERIKQPMYWNESAQGADGADGAGGSSHSNNAESIKAAPQLSDFNQFSLRGNLPLVGSECVTHISYFEADAFARWASESLPDCRGARLPTEFEWEVFAATQANMFKGLFGNVWQWTCSNYTPYPGYRPWSGLAGEYNGKFMVNQMVLRGSSAFTSPDHSRVSYRNFFPTHARWQLTGLRLAKDLS